jgi:hypothetical protein
MMGQARRHVGSSPVRYAVSAMAAHAELDLVPDIGNERRIGKTKSRPDPRGWAAHVTCLRVSLAAPLQGLISGTVVEPEPDRAQGQ